jgi:hypothetical protein
MDDADARREEHRRRVVRKANDENSKVDEVYNYTSYAACIMLVLCMHHSHAVCVRKCALLCCAMIPWLCMQ